MTVSKLRVLALAAQMDIGGNTPIEFLLEGSDVELITLYVVPGLPSGPIGDTRSRRRRRGMKLLKGA